MGLIRMGEVWKCNFVCCMCLSEYICVSERDCFLSVVIVVFIVVVVSWSCRGSFVRRRRAAIYFFLEENEIL